MKPTPLGNNCFAIGRNFARFVARYAQREWRCRRLPVYGPASQDAAPLDWSGAGIGMIPGDSRAGEYAVVPALRSSRSVINPGRSGPGCLLRYSDW